MATGPATEEARVRARRAEATRGRRRRNIVRPEDHPILDVQQAGFGMVERELGGLRRGLCSLNRGLNACVVGMARQHALLAQGVDALQRSAQAMEHLTRLRGAPTATAPPPSVAVPPPAGRPTTRAAGRQPPPPPPPPPRPSRGQSTRRGPRLRGKSLN